jgi:hypothetical protein
VMVSPRTEYRFEPGRPVAQLGHHMLHHLVLRENHRYASLNEYARASGAEIAQVTDAFSRLVGSGLVEFEFCNGEVFVRTAPMGRPVPRALPDIAPNLWEKLRASAPIDRAYDWWLVIRALESGGWEIETNAARVAAGASTDLGISPVGVWVGHRVVPLLATPAVGLVLSTTGVLEHYERLGLGAVALTCDSGALDDMVTAVRRWAGYRRVPPTLAVVVLEAPRFDPVLITPSDPAVPARVVERASLQTWS